MDFRCIASFLNSPDSVEDLSIYSPMSDDDVIHVKVTRLVFTSFLSTNEPRHEKINNLHMRKQRR